MLKKTRSGETGKAKVTFVLSSQRGADHIHVAGDFNDWQASTPMRRQKDGSFRATVELEPGREYQFRYLVDGNSWVNDEAADAYYPNPFGADNSVVRTPQGEGVRTRSSARGASGARAGAAGASKPIRADARRTGGGKVSSGETPAGAGKGLAASGQGSGGRARKSSVPTSPRTTGGGGARQDRGLEAPSGKRARGSRAKPIEE